MKELVILSGKGGTGKTSVTASFAVLAGRSVIADCDVDAADLHLVLSPQVKQSHEFRSGHEAIIRQDACIGCGACLAYCRYDAVKRLTGEEAEAISRTRAFTCKDCDFCVRSCPVKTNDLIQAMKDSCGNPNEAVFWIDPIACEGCGVCVRACPVQAIDFPESVCGEWMVSETRCGPMVHARLGIAAENSGKLVSTVRREARRIAEKEGHRFIIVDGSPGIGCPVIASITGAHLVLAITEPTLSGEHDLKRVMKLTRHFGIPMLVCVNKWDLNPEMTARIEKQCQVQSIPLAGRIRYDPVVTQAQIAGKAVVETAENGAAEDIRCAWETVKQVLSSGLTTTLGSEIKSAS